MNAYELAKELKEDTCIQIGSLKPKELADVLIQMADRIAELEDRLSMYEIKDLDKPHPKCDEACMYLCQMRELTDEEIIAVGNAVVNHIDSNEGWIEFARAILRKAQEK